MPRKALSQLEQEATKSEWNYNKDTHENYKVILVTLKSTFKCVTNKAYHMSGNTTLMSDGFGNQNLFTILQCLCLMYGKATIQEMEQKLLNSTIPWTAMSPSKS